MTCAVIKLPFYGASSRTEVNTGGQVLDALGRRQLSAVMHYIDASDDMLRKAVELA